MAEKKPVSYDAGAVAAAILGDEKAIRFLSIAKSFKIHVYSKQTGALETGSGELQVKFKTDPIQIEFRNCMFSTSDEDIIEKLRQHKSYGGSASDGFKRPEGAGEPLFFEGSYPEDVTKKLAEDAGYLRQQEGFYEGADKKERYSNQ